ncbi:hypothetical protein, conserved [Eimeria acervulina]|uniref:Uncharacterized protein n=1 Tax=Eimeria acervulina TaxID=5801 RepID=U6JRT6_EIMAC|nr:hypothetical protein, conserved [Eimeria acervulina]CDJ26797.1 hypothetical protein, conserved [Eimeria acervulina]
MYEQKGEQQSSSASAMPQLRRGARSSPVLLLQQQQRAHRRLPLVLLLLLSLLLCRCNLAAAAQNLDGVGGEAGEFEENGVVTTGQPEGAPAAVDVAAPTAGSVPLDDNMGDVVELQGAAASDKSAKWKKFAPAAALLIVLGLILAGLFGGGAAEETKEPVKVEGEEEEETPRGEDEKKETPTTEPAAGETSPTPTEGEEQQQEETPWGPPEQQEQEPEPQQPEPQQPEPQQEEEEQQPTQPELQPGEGEGEEEEEEEEEEEVDEEAIAEQSYRLQTFRGCFFPASSLDTALGLPESAALVADLEQAIQGGMMYRDLALAGDAGALAAFGRANDEASGIVAGLDDLARQTLVALVQKAEECPGAAETADAAVAARPLEQTGAAGYVEAWEQLLGICETGISFWRGEASSVAETLLLHPPLQPGEKEPSMNWVLVADRVGVDAANRSLDEQDTISEVARRLQETALQLLKHHNLGTLEAQLVKVAAQEEVCALMLEGVEHRKKQQGATVEDDSDLQRWLWRQKGCRESLDALQQHLGSVHSAGGFSEANRAVEAAEEALSHLNEMLTTQMDELIGFFGEAGPPTVSELLQEQLHPGEPVTPDEMLAQLPASLGGFDAAAEHTEQLLEGLFASCEVQLGGMGAVPWMPQAVLETMGQQLGAIMKQTQVKKDALITLVGDIQKKDDVGVLLASTEVATKAAAMYGQQRSAVWQLQQDIDALELMNVMVSSTKGSVEEALDAMAGMKVLSPEEQELAAQLEEKMDAAYKAATSATTLADALSAGSQYINAGRKQHDLITKAVLTDTLRRADEAAAGGTSLPFPSPRRVSTRPTMPPPPPPPPTHSSEQASEGVGGQQQEQGQDDEAAEAATAAEGATTAAQEAATTAGEAAAGPEAQGDKQATSAESEEGGGWHERGEGEGATSAQEDMSVFSTQETPPQDPERIAGPVNPDEEAGNEDESGLEEPPIQPQSAVTVGGRGFPPSAALQMLSQPGGQDDDEDEGGVWGDEDADWEEDGGESAA